MIGLRRGVLERLIRRQVQCDTEGVDLSFVFLFLIPPVNIPRNVYQWEAM